MNKNIALVAIALLLPACAWVKLTPEGEKVRVLSAAEVSSCKSLGTTTAKVPAKIGWINVEPHKIQPELEMLARNSAVDMKGDTVVPVGEPDAEGKQDFKIYRCVNP
jgi:hypothetical protein